MKANRVLAVTFILVLGILVACTATPATPASAPPPAATASPVPPAPTPVPPTATSMPPAATAVPSTPPPVLPTPVPALMDVVKAYETAVNRDDASGIPALFPEHFLNGWWEAIMVDQKQLAGAYDLWAGEHDGMALTECGQSQENQVRCGATVWDDCVKAAGVPAIKVSLGFIIIDKKIKTLSWQLAESSQADFSEYESWVTNASQWMRQERPALAAKVFDSRGGYIGGGEAGAAWLQICQEYAATLK